MYLVNVINESKDNDVITTMMLCLGKNLCIFLNNVDF